MYLSSFSATVAPGLRVGWMILPDELAVRAGELASSTSITPVQLGQAAVFELIRRGSFESNLMRLRDALRLRRDSIVAALGAYLPDALWTTPAGWHLPLARAARRHRQPQARAAVRGAVRGAGHELLVDREPPAPLVRLGARRPRSSPGSRRSRPRAASFYALKTTKYVFARRTSGRRTTARVPARASPSACRRTRRRSRSSRSA